MKMTLLKKAFSVEGICKKKILIYIVAISCIVTLLVAALVVVFFTTWAYNPQDEADNWSYQDQDKWPTLCHTSKQQSPIALNQRFAYKYQLPPIKLENFGECDCLQIENNGHTVTVSPLSGCSCRRPKLSGAKLTQNYTFENFHFHWPSEHTIDGLKYDLEAHFVFYADKYGSFKEALNHPYGLTVLAVLFVETNYTASNNLRIIADAVKSVSSEPGKAIPTTKPIKFHDFLPYDHEIYFTYQGSLTTPNCAEFVNWIVYKNHSNISYLDLKDISHIYNHDHELLKFNNRQLQDLNNRTVYMQENAR